MRICSSYKDYYDVVQSEGQDQTVIYERYPKEVILDNFPFQYWLSYREQPNFCVKSYTIGFCGKVYPVLEMNKAEYQNADTKEARNARRYCFNVDDVDEYVRANFTLREYQDWQKSNWKNNIWSQSSRKHQFETFFENYEKYKDGYVKFFEENRCPVFVAEKIDIKTKGPYNYPGKIIYNGSLRQLQFYRIFDPFQAFQEINMWLNNQAIPIKDIPKLDDEIMAEIKGFNKYSFRKDPSKKKKRAK